MNIPIHVFGTIDLTCLHLGYQCNFITQSYDKVALVEAKAKDGRTKAAMEVLKNKEK